MTELKAFLVATAKNEAPYFLEWVAHHMELGFTDIVIFQNDSDDLTHETLVALRDIGAIQYFYNRAETGAHQVRAYIRAAKLEAFQQADWAMALDLDEFLVVKTGDGRLTDLLDAIPESDCVHLNWRLFGNSGYETMTDQLVTERFSMAHYQLGDADQFGAYKCLFRPSHFERAGIHRPNGPKMAEDKIRYTNGSGLSPDKYLLKNYNSTDPGGCALAQINHYITRDLASFMLKSDRGSAHQANRSIGKRFWRMRNTNFEIDDSMRPFVERVQARMEALDKASDGRLMELRETAIYTHMARYYTMLLEKPKRAFRTMCKDNPNAIDHRKLAAEKVKSAAKASSKMPAPARSKAKEPTKTSARAAKKAAQKTSSKAAT